MAVQQQKRAVGTFSNRQKAEDALNTLKNSNFPMEKVSVLAKDADTDKDKDSQIGGAQLRDSKQNEAEEGAGIGAVGGTVLGGVGGLLVGLGVLAIPGAGPFLAAGTLATTFAGAGIGAAAGSVIGALTKLGIPEEQAQVYSRLVSEGEYLVMVDGTQEEISHATSILSDSGIRDWAVYDAPTQPMPESTRTNSTLEPTRTNSTDLPPTGSMTSDHEVIEIVDKRNEVR
ncbi:signal transduction histidine kinase LytS [Aetokthonos hydrillicola Thurmond2011]|jgi:hypothetical protein|uniref:Signal transduction histidine kinase LytS n=1 Tax=Aetokthonos hydrillicola Thurmond2011 TaxID=2712845 RepID=A0AAP5M731_9CYAN|nr:signal transduction histidine kinase LytS [Aetokthonos hydrillicola]MBW4586104.1 signal transduction histidine kinase LytS [Aetokthonos hydrillicola CCALA 1050]MDR9897711.1 signal transduction histidine kinase LytS [Aetokthonos hydrillicola Thurmond2011]